MSVPSAAGGSADVLARVVGQHMSQTLGQRVVIEKIAATNKNLPVKDIKELIEYSKANLGKVGYHTRGVGSRWVQSPDGRQVEARSLSRSEPSDVQRHFAVERSGGNHGPSRSDCCEYVRGDQSLDCILERCPV